MRPHRFVWICFFCWVFLLVPLCAGAQDAQEEARRILDRMAQKYKDEVADIDTYTIETDAYTAHYTKKVVDGWPAFTVRVESENSLSSTVSDIIPGVTSIFDPEIFQELRERAVYAGRHPVDGRPMDGIRIDRLDGLFGGDEQVSAEKVLLVVDAETLDLDRIRARIRMPGPTGQMQTVPATIRMQDYRDIQGLRVAHKHTINLKGVAGGFSETERQQALQLLRSLEQVPAEQRAMIEGMLPPGQIQQAQKVLSGEPLVMEIVVRRVRVNTESFPGQ